MENSTDKRIDSRSIRISGAAEVEHSLLMDQDVTLLVKGSVTDIRSKSNQDGSVNLVFVIKADTVEVEPYKF